MRHTRAVSLCAALLTIAGCTSNPPERPSSTPSPTASETQSATETPEPPTPGAAELAPALLTKAHLGRGFTVVNEPDPEFHTVLDDPDGRLGCLRKLDAVDFGVPDDGTAMRVIDAKNDAKTPHLVQLVGSSESVADAHAGFRSALSVIRSCGRVKTRADDIKVDAPVRVNRAKAIKTVDQQLNVRAVGTMRILRSTFPIGVWLSIVRIDEQVLIVSLLDLDKDDAPVQRELTEAAVRRLNAVLTGRPLPPARRIRLETRLPH